MSSHAEHIGHAAHRGASLNRTAALATLHCLAGCAIGEVIGMVIGTAFGLSNAATIALAVLLAFAFGYSLTMLPLLRAGLGVAVAVPLAFASDSFSIAVMELVDNGVMLAVPGAMDAPLSNPLFWGALALALAVAYAVALPVNRYLIARGRGHAVVHSHHGHEMHGGQVAGHATAVRASSIASPRKLILIGVAAMAVTIGAAAGGALLIETHGEPGRDRAPGMVTDGGHEAPARPGSAGHGLGVPR
jgi:hypothetical protein